MKKLGFIGMGNMAAAILQGAVKSGFLQGSNMAAYDHNDYKLENMHQKCGLYKAKNLIDLAENSEILMMAVKPANIPAVLEELGAKLNGKALLSIAVGWQYEQYRQVLHPSCRVCFIMPNTPCMVGAGMSVIEAANNLTAAELEFAKGLFGRVGETAVLPSAYMDAAGALSGCGPAWIYMAIEGLADGAVRHGLTRELAYRLAAQMVIGAGHMVKESGLHPGALKDQVCSPGGATIRGVQALEENGLRAALMRAVGASVKPAG